MTKPTTTTSTARATRYLFEGEMLTASEIKKIVPVLSVHTIANHVREGRTTRQVLVAGGFDGSGALASAELYDPATNTWSAAASLATARDSRTATLLPSGQVLVAGGWNNVSALASAELYTPEVIFRDGFDVP